VRKSCLGRRAPKLTPIILTPLVDHRRLIVEWLTLVIFRGRPNSTPWAGARLQRGAIRTAEASKNHQVQSPMDFFRRFRFARFEDVKGNLSLC
jgi:hypothetical protein